MTDADWLKLIEMIEALGLKVRHVDRKNYSLTVWIPPPSR